MDTSTKTDSAIHPALTSLSDVEEMFREVVRDFAASEASRLLVYNAARLKDAGEDFLVPVAMAKLHSSRMAQKVTSLCIDLCGGFGFTKEYPVEKFYRDSKIDTIYEGTTNMQLQTIAKALLG